jgi:hypothetical protein
VTEAGLMLALTASHPDALSVMLAAGRGGGRAVIWILGWLIVLGVIVGAVIYAYRRRDRHSAADDDRGRKR